MQIIEIAGEVASGCEPTQLRSTTPVLMDGEFASLTLSDYLHVPDTYWTRADRATLPAEDRHLIERILICKLYVGESVVHLPHPMVAQDVVGAALRLDVRAGDHVLINCKPLLPQQVLGRVCFYAAFWPHDPRWEFVRGLKSKK